MKKFIVMAGAAVLVLGAGLFFNGGPPLLAVAAPAPVQQEKLAAGETADSDRMVVVELFTSQGCNSCPPADAFLGELAGEANVLALSLHIDYWDYIGWKDPFALPINTQRQRDYAKRLSLRYVYTPQMVIDGADNVVGTRRGKVRKAIDEALRRPAAVAVDFDRDAGKVRIGEGHAPDGGATVWLAIYDSKQTTEIRRGENAGKSLSYHNVVREMHQLATWNGQAVELALDLEAARAQGRGGCAIIVQQGRTGPVLGAAEMKLDGEEG